MHVVLNWLILTVFTAAKNHDNLIWRSELDHRSRRNLLNRKRGSIAYSLLLSTSCWKGRKIASHPSIHPVCPKIFRGCGNIYEHEGNVANRHYFKSSKSLYGYPYGEAENNCLGGNIVFQFWNHAKKFFSILRCVDAFHFSLVLSPFLQGM